MSAEEPRDPARPAGRVEIDRESVERDLMKLVLTIVELLRQLMEKQVLRRIDQGDLSDDQIEDLGMSLMHLESAMTELTERFGLTAADLNIELGPLGPLLPRQR
ncbi:gas vesicle protein K [Pseudonocardia sp. HH130630-07]|uniref:gas vesicle protein K n=1 Tax=Pseudonocardia sp. HH130630-07 TaxID=1690815 RepID=UPI00081515A5|nr:gas vesicle protein K [Pseudonocardia sp. HH130630-07]ANY05038.1 gas vesicle protein GvpK [Pseudonocardia sp. HH130630-07]